ncbi:MAG: tRNA (guanosine(18)-2'-O)-methyltransferase [Formosa sp. Hel1_33_131]|jgi:tRNA G18 (ribose-2'-O)-methylase SpoU|nr:MAG: tRNA (guanosine(18)-2'-O)-methyltransferase [Formosa sp. Hel1_33_131]
MQLNHYTTTFSKHTFPIILISDNVSHAANIGSLFRTADAFGVQHLILGGNPIELGRKFTKTSRATEHSVSFEQTETTLEKIRELKSQNYTLIALEITEKSRPISELELPNDSKIGFIIGDEKHGVSAPILEVCDHNVHIEMYGQNSSMNVVQATSIGLYELTKKLALNS